MPPIRHVRIRIIIRGVILGRVQSVVFFNGPGSISPSPQIVTIDENLLPAETKDATIAMINGAVTALVGTDNIAVKVLELSDPSGFTGLLAKNVQEVEWVFIPADNYPNAECTEAQCTPAQISAIDALSTLLP